MPVRPSSSEAASPVIHVHVHFDGPGPRSHSVVTTPLLTQHDGQYQASPKNSPSASITEDFDMQVPNGEPSRDVSLSSSIIAASPYPSRSNSMQGGPTNAELSAAVARPALRGRGRSLQMSREASPQRVQAQPPARQTAQSFAAQEPRHVQATLSGQDGFAARTAHEARLAQRGANLSGSPAAQDASQSADAAVSHRAKHARQDTHAATSHRAEHAQQDADASASNEAKHAQQRMDAPALTEAKHAQHGADAQPSYEAENVPANVGACGPHQEANAQPPREASAPAGATPPSHAEVPVPPPAPVAANFARPARVRSASAPTRLAATQTHMPRHARRAPAVPPKLYSANLALRLLWSPQTWLKSMQPLWKNPHEVRLLQRGEPRALPLGARSAVWEAPLYFPTHRQARLFDQVLGGDVCWALWVDGFLGGARLLSRPLASIPEALYLTSYAVAQRLSATQRVQSRSGVLRGIGNLSKEACVIAATLICVAAAAVATVATVGLALLGASLGFVAGGALRTLQLAGLLLFHPSKLETLQRTLPHVLLQQSHIMRVEDLRQKRCDALMGIVERRLGGSNELPDEAELQHHLTAKPRDRDALTRAAELQAALLNSNKAFDTLNCYLFSDNAQRQDLDAEGLGTRLRPGEEAQATAEQGYYGEAQTMPLPQVAAFHRLEPKALETGRSTALRDYLEQIDPLGHSLFHLGLPDAAGLHATWQQLRKFLDALRDPNFREETQPLGWLITAIECCRQDRHTAPELREEIRLMLCSDPQTSAI